jgi:hypothetical protein
MRNYSAENYHRSFCLCRFHSTPCARSSHARGHARRRWRSGCEVGRDDLQVFSLASHHSVPMRNYSASFFSQIILPLLIPCHTMRALVPCQCARGHARSRWRSGCEVGRDDLQVFSLASHRSVPMRNYSANIFHRSLCLCRFHATPCARSSHASARADMHAAAVQPPPPPPAPTLAMRDYPAT